jgi:hypothetical protein
MPATSHKASVATMPGRIAISRRWPAGSHLCATNNATVRTTTAMAMRKKVKVPSSGSSHGA